MRPRLTDYWDQRAGAIDASANELSKLSNRKREHALEQIKEAIARHVEALPSEMLLPASVAIVDDLYAAGCSANRWDEPLAQYLGASAGTLAQLLTRSGLTLQYLVDNAWEDMTRPYQLFSDWFTACGFAYVGTAPGLVDS